MVGRGRDGLLEHAGGTDGRYGRDICTCKHTIWLVSLSSPHILFISPPHQHLISSKHATKKTHRDGESKRERIREREEREPPKKASIWETEFFISIHKKRGWGGFLVCCSGPEKREAEEGGHKPQNPLSSCLLLSLNSVYCACSTDYFLLSSYPLPYILYSLSVSCPRAAAAMLASFAHRS